MTSQGKVIHIHILLYGVRISKPYLYTNHSHFFFLEEESAPGKAKRDILIGIYPFFSSHNRGGKKQDDEHNRKTSVVSQALGKWQGSGE